MDKQPVEKLYCYVDETGQDTLGRFFIVVAVVLGDERLTLEKFLEECERKSHKGTRKWTNTPDKAKIAYITQATSDTDLLTNPVYIERFGKGLDYDHRTFIAIRDALNTYLKEHELPNYHITILVDGLNAIQQRNLKKAFTQTGMNTSIRGIRDESSSLTRFADAVAGLVRDADGRPIFGQVVKQRIKRGIFRELK